VDTLQCIEKRRSIRRFQKSVIPKADLLKIVNAGRLAASGSNKQPWEFIVITEKVTINIFALIRKWIVNASAVIVVVITPKTRWWIQDGSAAIENMLLACTALGYGSCWVEGDVLLHEEEIKPLFGIPPEKRIMAIIPIGKPDETPKPKKKPLEQLIHWERY
jgi:nitroreductase